MTVCLHAHQIATHRVCEARLSTGQLFERMELTEKKPATGPEHTRGLRKDRSKIIHMFEHEISDDDVHRAFVNRPASPDVVLNEPRVRRHDTLPGEIQHAG